MKFSYRVVGGPFGLMTLEKQNPDGDWDEGINGESSMAILNTETPEVGASCVCVYTMAKYIRKRISHFGMTFDRSI